MTNVITKIKLIMCCAILFAGSTAHATETTKKVLDNGMTVVVTEMPNSQLVSVFAMVKTGSATEGKYLGSGVSHLLEHMLFKGTAKYGVGEIPAKIQSVGGLINASTGTDYTLYTITVPYEEFDTALEIQNEMLRFAVIDEKELEKEREVVHSEMRLYEDRPDRRHYTHIGKTVYLRHPYRHPIIGYRHLFDQLSRDDIMDYYKTHYAPNNIVFSVAGRINSVEAVSKIGETFKDFKRGTAQMRNLPQEPEQISTRRFEEEYPTPQARLSLAFKSTPLLHKDLFAMDVLADILGSGRNARLQKEIYHQKQLVYALNVYNYTPADQGTFLINMILDDKNIDRVIEEVLKEIKKIKQKGASEKELDRAKRGVLSERLFHQQNSSTVAHSQAYDEAFTGDHQFTDRYIDAIREVANEEIKAVAAKYLNVENMSIVILRPEGSKAGTSESIESQFSEIEKFTLSNGITVLLRKDDTYPTAFIRLALNGGLREEVDGLNGVAFLMKELWGKGTKKYSYEKFGDVIDALGMRVGPFMGKNSFGISMSLLSEDMDVALEILEEMVKNPLFKKEQFEKEKERLFAKIDRRDDNIAKYTSLVLRDYVFPGHPYGNPEDGTKETVEEIIRDDVEYYYYRLKNPDNMVIAVFGDIEPSEILDELEKVFGDLEADETTPLEHQVIPITKQTIIEKNLDKEQGMVMIGFQGVTVDSGDRYGVEVLSSILGSSFSGRLFTRIREELGKAYTLGGTSVPGIDTGLIYFYVQTAPDDVEQVKAALIEEIERVQTEDATDEELEDIKSYLKGRNKGSIETNFGLAFSASLDELYGLGFNDYKNYDANVDAVSKEQIKELAKKYLNIQKSVIVITRPSSEQSTNPEE